MVDNTVQFSEGDAVENRLSYKKGIVAQVLADEDQLLLGVKRLDKVTRKMVTRYQLVDFRWARKLPTPTAAERTGPRLTPTACARLFKAAHAAGLEAGKGSRPTPMVVGTPKNLIGSLTGGDDGGFDPAQPTYFIEGGVCGFAWVSVRPGNSSFARWLVKTGNGHKAYYGGVEIWVHEFGQSMERKEAYGRAFSNVLRDAGVNAYMGSRMD